MTAVDYVVVGQGLAGTAVAWHLRWRGCRVLVVDRGDPDSASRVAAGLVTPVTGKRLARTPGYDELYPAAVAFYRRVEAETGRHVFTARDAVRVAADERERAKLSGRTPSASAGVVYPLARARGSPEAAEGSRPPLAETEVDPDWFAAPHGAFALSPAGRLDVPAYLDASRAVFAADGGFVAADLDPGRDVIPEPDGVRLPRFGRRARGVVFCQGFAGRSNTWFPDLPWNPAKGAVLTLRIPGLAEERVVHRGIWLAPVGDGLFLAGSPYDRDDLSPTPTARGRDQIVSRLREFLRLPFDVVGHRAAVRPVVAGLQPVFGFHREYRRLTYLNGLGSKGALTAAATAAAVVDLLVCNF
ncbi:MAG: FAD-binding oxidoreductase [Gemmataceae bacterium]|nr:FAD-binding oxidoreductase [Gemmataceae bacterium]